MRIGLIDVDGHNFPNLPLMKLSAWHKAKGDSVEWYEPMFSGHMDKVYMSKVFSFSPDYEYCIDADKIIKGGSGYCIQRIDGKEVYRKELDKDLPYEIEHIYPDYSIYGLEDTAIGFTSRGCPRGCDFCHVAAKEGCRSQKVADVSEFWHGQKNIIICDPNTLACREWKDILQQLIDSKAYVDFNQGLDIRMMTDEKAAMLSKIRMKELHFAWDRIEDEKIVVPKFEKFREMSRINHKKLIVYVLVGDREKKILDSDLHRIYWLREHGYSPYVMIYNKDELPKMHELKRLQRWVNNRIIFWSCSTFEEYGRKKLKGGEQ